jgi:broad specificity phosphatase PhoE
MKIIMRHGEYLPRTVLVNNNVGGFVSLSVFPSLAEKGREIRSRLKTVPRIYTSSADRAIETALLISPDGEEKLLAARKQISEMILKMDFRNRGGQWYQLFRIPLPEHIQIEKNLLNNGIHENIIGEDNIVIITHEDVLRGLNLTLQPGEFVEIP